MEQKKQMDIHVLGMELPASMVEEYTNLKVSRKLKEKLEKDLCSIETLGNTIKEMTTEKVMLLSENDKLVDEIKMLRMMLDIEKEYNKRLVASIKS